MKTINIIHGPNLNLLGVREVQIYGKKTLQDINLLIQNYVKKEDIKFNFFQSNHEGEIIDFIQQSYNKCDGIIINPAGLTHYSISIRDAIVAVKLPVIEVHLSNIYSREKIRRKSVISPVVEGVISGLGHRGYLYAVDAIIKIIKEE